jgi:hypothetical protein
MAKPTRNRNQTAPSGKRVTTSTSRRNGRGPRPIKAGDTAPNFEPQRLERFVVNESVSSAQEAQAEAIRHIVTSAPPHDVASLANSLRAILEEASPDDAAMLRQLLQKDSDASSDSPPSSPDTALADDWRDGGYPYKNLLSRKSYETQKYHLQVELLKLQAWVKAAKQKVVILFEGRDAAGKVDRVCRWFVGLGLAGDSIELQSQ